MKCEYFVQVFGEKLQMIPHLMAWPLNAQEPTAMKTKHILCVMKRFASEAVWTDGVLYVFIMGMCLHWV